MKVTLGFLLAFAIGVVCRLAAIPLPAPPMLIGALLVVAMTLGHIVTDRLAARRASRRAPVRGALTMLPEQVLP